MTSLLIMVKSWPLNMLIKVCSGRDKSFTEMLMVNAVKIWRKPKNQMMMLGAGSFMPAMIGENNVAV